MFILIGVWGSRDRKIVAAYKFFFYTFIGSIFFLLAILSIYSQVGSTDLVVLWSLCQRNTSGFSLFTFERQTFLFLAFMASFAVKLPMFPLHLWLPEAHVEASTAGSVLLAGILLKMGGYGIFRFVLPLFSDAVIFFYPLVYCLSLLAVFYTGLTTLRQIDLKKIIAYSSVGHMAYVVLGLFSNTFQGIEGAIFLMLSHGIVSSALFISVGLLYDRYKTRILFYYGGLVQMLPLFSGNYLFLTLANLGFPGTSSFIGEFLVFLSLFVVSPLACLLACLGVVLSACYSIWLYNRLFFGPLKVRFYLLFADLQWRECLLLLPFLYLILILGIYPSYLLFYFENPILLVLNSY